MQSFKDHFGNKDFRHSFYVGLFSLIASVVAQFYATTYATLRASGSVGDIILSNTNVHDVDGVFIFGSVLIFLIVVFICFRHPNYSPFLLKSVAVFTLIRSVFITLTHISPFPGHIIIDSAFFGDVLFRGIFTGDGLFFSGHTGLPFLFALMFWHNKTLRYIFLCFSVSFAVIVLLGHLHYSIDVLSAYFITYSIFHISLLFFKKDWKIFKPDQVYLSF